MLFASSVPVGLKTLRSVHFPWPSLLFQSKGSFGRQALTIVEYPHPILLNCIFTLTSSPIFTSVPLGMYSPNFWFIITFTFLLFSPFIFLQLSMTPTGYMICPLNMAIICSPPFIYPLIQVCVHLDSHLMVTFLLFLSFVMSPQPSMISTTQSIHSIGYHLLLK